MENVYEVYFSNYYYMGKPQAMLFVAILASSDRLLFQSEDACSYGKTDIHFNVWLHMHSILSEYDKKMPQSRDSPT